MPRLSYLTALCVLGLLAVFIARHLGGIPACPEVQQASIMHHHQGWLVQYRLFNKEAQPVDYTIVFTAGDLVYRDRFTIPAGRAATYTHHLGTEFRDRPVRLSIYQADAVEPMETTTFFLSHD